MSGEQRETSLRLVIMRGNLENTWIAICLEHYIVAQGTSTTDVIREFKAMLAAEIIRWIEHGKSGRPLDDIEPAPHKYWGLLDGATPHDPPSISVDTRIEPGPDTTSEPVTEIPRPEVRLRLAA